MSVASVPEIGPAEWDMQVVWLDPDEVVPNPDNPNQQDDRTFNALVASIKTDGWRDPSNVVWDDRLGKYELVAGEHRWRAAKVLGTKLPCIVLDSAQYIQDRRDWTLVKDNILAGKINPERFAKLYQRMAGKYDAEVLQQLMGFTDGDAFAKIYKEARAALSPEMAAALDATKAEIRTIDDLSTVLNRLFMEFGETLDSDYMVFSWAGKNVMWIRATKPLWEAVTGLAAKIHNDEESLAAELLRRLS